MSHNKPLNALSHILSSYENDRKHAYGEINVLLNSSDDFDMTDLINRMSACINDISLIEMKHSVTLSLITQAASQLTEKASEEKPA